MKGVIKRILGMGGLGIGLICSSYVYASGYKMEFQSPSVLADAGNAAVVEDAGTNWYNSAGLVYLPQQLAVNGTFLWNPVDYRGTAIAPSIIRGAPVTTAFVGHGDATSYNSVLIPGLHYALPLNDCYALGLSIVPAWGLLEDFGDTSLVRYDLVRIYTRSMDISPSIAFRWRQFSIGIGPDAHYWHLSSKAHVRTQPLTTGDSISRFSGDDWGYGGHVGLLYAPCESFRVGLNYRSKMVNTLKGYSDFVFFEGRAFESHNFRVKFALPPITDLSFYYAFNPCFAIMGTVTYEQWSTIRKLHGVNFVGPTGIPTSAIVPQNYHNTFDFGLGAHYRVNPQLLLRGSIKYLQTPTINRTRDINFPDGQKIGINLGLRYQYNCKVALDLLYAHVFIRTRHINFTNTFGSHLIGHTSSSAEIAGAQIVWNI